MADLTAASGATMIELLGQPKGESMKFNCVDGVGIEKGDILFMDPTVASGAALAADGKPFAGIAATEKVASDGSTTIGLYTRGVFDCTASGVIQVGELVVLSGQNLVCGLSNVAGSGSKIAKGEIVGKAREAATDGAVIAVEIGRY